MNEQFLLVYSHDNVETYGGRRVALFGSVTLVAQQRWCALSVTNGQMLVNGWFGVAATLGNTAGCHRVCIPSISGRVFFGSSIVRDAETRIPP